MSPPARLEPSQRTRSDGGIRGWTAIAISVLALLVSALTAFSEFTTQRKDSTSELHRLRNQVEEHFQRGENEEARLKIEEALSKAPRSHEVWVLEGRHRALTGDEEGAEKLFRQALHQDSRYSPAHFHLARLLRDKGDLDGARSHLEEALSIADSGGSDVGQAILWINLGDVLYDQRELDQAKGAYQKALQLDPGSAEARARLAEIYTEELRFEDAIEQYGLAVSADPKNPEYLRSAALVFYFADDYVRAEGLVRRSIELEATPEALELLALVLEDQGKDSGSVRERLEGLRSGNLWLDSARTKAPRADAGAEGEEAREGSGSP